MLKDIQRRMKMDDCREDTYPTPPECPQCGYDMEWNKEGTNVECANPDCEQGELEEMSYEDAKADEGDRLYHKKVDDGEW